ncbi:MAG: hypothetical protein ACJ79O_16960 [Myxococcales bacterium]
MTSLRGNRSFLLLFFARVVSLTGSGVTTVGLALFAYQLTGGPFAAAALRASLQQNHKPAESNGASGRAGRRAR